MKPPPPPIPEIEYVRFEGTVSGFHTAARDRTRLELAQKAATEWLKSEKNIEVISIDSCFGNLAAFVTVWFRRAKEPIERVGKE